MGMLIAKSKDVIEVQNNHGAANHNPESHSDFKCLRYKQNVSANVIRAQAMARPTDFQIMPFKRASALLND